jgi:hypothetical protein
MYRGGNLPIVDRQNFTKNKPLEVDMLKMALGEKLARLNEPTFDRMTRDDQLRALRVSLIDDPLTASLYSAAAPYIASAASSLG